MSWLYGYVAEEKRAVSGLLHTHESSLIPHPVIWDQSLINQRSPNQTNPYSPFPPILIPNSLVGNLSVHTFKPAASLSLSPSPPTQIKGRRKASSFNIDASTLSILLLNRSSNHTWQPTMTSDTTAPSYWLNWRFFLCALWILIAMAIASFLIWKYEEFNKLRTERQRRQRETVGSLYEDEAWNTCLKGIHPAWLLTYRIISFTVLLALLIANVVADGGGIFYFYTQWTFTLVTIYFGLGSCFSIYGCYFNNNEFGGSSVNHAHLDAEQGTYVAPTLDGTVDMTNPYKSSGTYQERHTQNTAGVWGYIFQIIFQTCAGAVALTDCVFWLIIYPFLTAKDFSLDFLVVCMHSVNALFLLGDTSLNCMRFPMFRFAYFVLWTAIFVIFQWIIHMCVSLWWPYPFLDLSSPYAPLWYLAVGVLHIPCYGVFALIVRLKQLWLSRSFPGSCQFVR